MQNFDHNIGFCEKRQFFRRKLSKIAENCYHNIDPWSPGTTATLFLQKICPTRGLETVSSFSHVSHVLFIGWNDPPPIRFIWWARLPDEKIPNLGIFGGLRKMLLFLWLLGIFYGYFDILHMYDHLLHFVFIWYIFPVSISCSKKNLAAPLMRPDSNE
jgi:hypothetical protein